MVFIVYQTPECNAATNDTNVPGVFLHMNCGLNVMRWQRWEH
jgi:hypothetical protein